MITQELFKQLVQKVQDQEREIAELSAVIAEIQQHLSVEADKEPRRRKVDPWTAFPSGDSKRLKDHSQLVLELSEWLEYAWPHLISPHLLGGVKVLASCWPSHPGVVDELLALHSAWLAAYTSGLNVVNETRVNWHDRWASPCANRLSTVHSIVVNHNAALRKCVIHARESA